jgi:hypothetical protein
MENEGIAVGIKHNGTTNWYRAHSLTRRPDGAMAVFSHGPERMVTTVPARLFAGVSPTITDNQGNLYPELDAREFPSA